MGVNFTWEMSPDIDLTFSEFDPMHCVNRNIQYRLQLDGGGEPKVLANYNTNQLIKMLQL